MTNEEKYTQLVKLISEVGSVNYWLGYYVGKEYKDKRDIEMIKHYGKVLSDNEDRLNEYLKRYMT